MVILTGEEIYKLVNGWLSSQEYKDMLDGKRYYICKNDILKRKFYYFKINEQVEDIYRSNIKVANDFLKIIIDQKVSYCLSKDVIIDNILDLPFDINDEIDYVAEDASQKNVGWCYVWIDPIDGTFKQKQVDAENLIPIYDNTIEEKLTAILRFYIVDKDKYVEYWDAQNKTLYIEDGPKYVEISTEAHFNDGSGWGKVPFVRLRNNKYGMNDLSNIKSLIDAYDWTISDFANNFIDFQELIYKLVDYAESLRDEQSLAELIDFLKKYKIISVGEKGDFEVVTTEVPYEARSQFLEILRKNIFMMSHSVDTEKLSGGDLTNVTIKAYFQNLDQKCNKFLKECKRYVLDMLYFSNRYKEINNMPTDDLTKVNVKFNKSLIINEVEVIETLITMGLTLSKETLVKLCPWVDDPDEELKKIEAQETKEAKEMDPNPTKEVNFNKMLEQ